MAGLKEVFCALLLLNILGSCVSQEASGDFCVTARKRNGTCVPITQCQAALDQVKMKQKPEICSFDGATPIVCCDDLGDRLPPFPVEAQMPGEKAEKWCREYVKDCPTERIIAGGEDADVDEFPHMAAIGYGEENKIKWLCGGSLITPKFVLSAAHCLSSPDDGLARWVLLGSVSLTSGDGILYPIIRLIAHPEYKAPSKYHDLALLELGDPRPQKNNRTSVIHPACLPSLSFNYKTAQAIATGWGRTGFAEDSTEDLQKVTLDILDTAVCNTSFDVEIRTTSFLNRGINNQMMCAGVLGGGKDTCQGDSGGPLLSTKKVACLHVLLGVTSFGKVCAFANSPAVYTRVSEYILWIEKVIP